MGGWTWKYVRPLLRAAGHEVFSPSFTGFAEHAHLMRRDTTHGVHVQDISSLIACEDMQDVVLVGHSYSGTVIPGVVKAHPNAVRRAIFLDAIVARSGERVATAMGMVPEEQAAGLDAMLAAGDGPIGSGVDEQQRAMAKDNPHMMDSEREAWLLRHLSDMPLRCTISPIETGAETLTIPVDYIAAQHTIMTIMHDRARELGWTMHQHPGDHALLVGDPEGVARLLLDISA
ncbi:esterase [Sphingobium sp. TCM1]|nr:esterase [Sphingobium sp. TCM1]